VTISSAYLAPEGLETVLEGELGRAGVTISGWHGRLALSPDPAFASVWALDVWTAPREIEIASVKSAADALRALQRNWSAYPVLHHRRMALIADRLPPV
jgi:23S rRNA (cytidine2498-2'-O)-methyltransferase